jgi:hypothetical protein
MRVYHGSYVAITEIDLSQCEPRKDFGRGFYVTKFREQAEIWAAKKGNRKHTNGIITEFEFDQTVYEDKNFRVLCFDGYTDEWFDFVIQNRKSVQQTHDYDIVEGPVADDKIQRELDMFLKNKITRDNFFEQLVHPQSSHQICFCTFNSLLMLDYVEYKTIINVEDVGEKVIATLIADFGCSEKNASEQFYTSQTFAQLADESTELYKRPWQEIYGMLKKEIEK